MAALAEILPFENQTSLPTSLTRPPGPGEGLELMHKFASYFPGTAGFKLERAYYWSRHHWTGHVVKEDRQPFRDMALCGQRQGVAVRLRLTGRIASVLHNYCCDVSHTFSCIQLLTPTQGSHTSGLKCCTGTSALHSRWVQCNHTLSNLDGSSGQREMDRARPNVLR